MQRSLLNFYILVIYVILQFFWWAYLINSLNQEVHDQKLKLAFFENSGDTRFIERAHRELSEKRKHRWLMIAGEGTVFVIVLGMGIIQTRKSFRKEVELAKAKNNFLLAVTHELKSPLAAIKLQAETLLKRKLTEEKVSDLLNSTIRESDRLEKLVESILLASRLDTHTYQPFFTVFDVVPVIHEVGKKLSETVLKQHRLTIKTPPSCLLNADKLAIESIMVNLLENAAKYSPVNSTISAELQIENGTTALVIRDEGKGIPENQWPLVFNMFYRIGDEETRSNKGTGLGLYIVKHLSDLHHAAVSIKPNSPKGTIFEILFPETKKIS